MALFENLEDILGPGAGEFWRLGSCSVRGPDEERRDVRVGRGFSVGGFRDDELE